MTQVRGDRCE